MIYLNLVTILFYCVVQAPVEDFSLIVCNKDGTFIDQKILVLHLQPSFDPFNILPSLKSVYKLDIVFLGNRIYHKGDTNDLIFIKKLWKTMSSYLLTSENDIFRKHFFLSVAI